MNTVKPAGYLIIAVLFLFSCQKISETINKQNSNPVETQVNKKVPDNLDNKAPYIVHTLSKTRELAIQQGSIFSNL
tara:strand:- start:1708 stop:1935 length:228 start_codon:yes stop_codon:yes gene_type:complete